MATDVTMPRLSDSMEEGTVLKWLVAKGDEVARGQELVEIETDKANMTYESDTDGTLVEIVAQEGDTLPIGELIARIGEAGEEASDGGAAAGESGESDGEGAHQAEAGESDGESPDGDAAATAADSGEGEEPDAEEEAPAPPSSTGDDGAEGSSNGAGGGDGAAAGERVKASPVARRVASELGVELSGLEGSGPGGRIVKADVQAAADGGGGPADGGGGSAEEEAGEAAPATEQDDGKERRPSRPASHEPQPAGEAGAKGELQVQELTRLQQTVSRRMAESKATAPDYALNADVDMTGCVELRARLKEVADPAPSYNDMVVKACANALREYPRVNGAYRDGRFERYSRVNVGLAVAAQDTLVVPTLFDADARSLGAIATRARELIGKVRDGSITPPELSGGTFTVSNLGMYGIDSFSAVINPPQAALLAVGALKKRAIVEESGRIVARDMMTVTLVSDHRILYGADGAEFLARVRELLEQPLALAL
jgi:pyruvate dehydrogenase E2 component (dihydrolipoamide acetyltransferase)